MNLLPFMPLYWNDLLSDNKVRVMSNEELGAYMRLLGAAWHEDIPGTIPADDDVLARLAGAELSLWRKLSRRILPCFVLNEQSGRYEQKRMMLEYAKCLAQAEMKHARATAGAGKRWEGHVKKSPSNAQAMLKHKDSNASHIQSQNQEEDTNTQRPRGMPVSADEAVAMCQTSAIPPEFVRAIWDQLEVRGWVDGAGQPVRNKFAVYVAGRWEKQRDKTGRQAALNGTHRNGNSGGFSLSASAADAHVKRCL